MSLNLKFNYSYSSDELAQFFVDNVSPKYISHSELQGYRAIDKHTWNKDLLETIKLEFLNANHVITALVGKILVGIGIISINKDALIPYATVEDIIIKKEYQGRNIGSELLSEIEAYATEQGCKRLFLESGVTNIEAHQFFFKNGFNLCSFVMAKSI